MRQKTFRAEGVILEQVTEYKYLGSWITSDCKCQLDLKRKVGQAKSTFWNHKELRNHQLPIGTKLKILNTFVFPVISYGSECWTINNKMKVMINAAEVWCYRRMLRISWIEKNNK